MNILAPKACIKVVSTSNISVPCDFPWKDGVHVSLIGDLSNLNNLQHELEEIKKLVNKDISKFKMNLKDFSIEITWQKFENSLDNLTPEQEEEINKSHFLIHPDSDHHVLAND